MGQFIRKGWVAPYVRFARFAYRPHFPGWTTVLPVMHTRDMNKAKRKALIESLITELNMSATLTESDANLARFIKFAGRLTDAKTEGRTERWKSACTLAGRRILIAERDQLTVESVRNKCAQGLEAMANANK